jgi:glycosyltransferase involved in cell wall biosynthesis
LSSVARAMSSNLLSIVTTTFNCRTAIEGYVDAVGKLDRSQFDWIVVDAGSSDGTAEFLAQRAHLFDYHASEVDAGVYYGLNKAVARTRTAYYIVLGADDRPAPTLLDDLLPLLHDNPALVLGNVRLVPGGALKRPGPRWIHPVVWGRAVSHHSVGTVIRTDMHAKFGVYDTDFRVVADGLFLKRVLQSDEKIVISNAVFGDYALGGISDKSRFRSIVETFMLQISAGSNLLLQLMLLNARLLKLALLQTRRKS